MIPQIRGDSRPCRRCEELSGEPAIREGAERFPSRIAVDVGPAQLVGLHGRGVVHRVALAAEGSLPLNPVGVPKSDVIVGLAITADPSSDSRHRHTTCDERAPTGLLLCALGPDGTSTGSEPLGTLSGAVELALQNVRTYVFECVPKVPPDPERSRPMWDVSRRQ